VKKSVKVLYPNSASHDTRMFCPLLASHLSHWCASEPSLNFAANFCITACEGGCVLDSLPYETRTCPPLC
jgi:hypothetical protein